MVISWHNTGDDKQTLAGVGWVDGMATTLTNGVKFGWLLHYCLEVVEREIKVEVGCDLSISSELFLGLMLPVFFFDFQKSTC